MQYTPSAPRRLARQAFSLIEVNMAILIVAGGLLTLVTLFPAGLRMSMSSVEDTRIALFSSDALHSLCANAAAVPLDTWKAAPLDFWKAIATEPLFTSAKPPSDEAAPVNNDELQRFVIEGEVDDYFSGPGNDPRLGKVPVRYRILLERRRNALDKLNQHLDFMIWRISLAASDKPGLLLKDIEFGDLPVYHVEVRYGALP